MKKEKNPGGAPTKYKEEFCQEIIKFFDREPYEPVMYEDDGRMIAATTKSGAPVFKPTPLPTKANFATHIGVHRETINNWAKEHPKFFDAVKRAEAIQEDLLMQGGLAGTYDKTFSIFTAKNVMGWSDKGKSDFAQVDFGDAKTPVEKCQKIIDAAAAGNIAMDKADKYIGMFSVMLKIDELTQLRQDVEEIKKALENQDG